jgi:hypothetical protein
MLSLQGSFLPKLISHAMLLKFYLFDLIGLKYGLLLSTVSPLFYIFLLDSSTVVNDI